MPHRTPSWDGLRIFAACARLGSFTRAACKLHMSVSAVSYQIARLEDELGVPLFDRGPRGSILSKAGEALLPAVAAMERELVHGLQHLEAGPESELRITAIGDLGVYWLMPRLAEFSRLHPDLDVSIDTSSEIIDLAAEGFHMAIRHGSGQWPELQSVKLRHWSLVPMAAPSLLPKLGRTPAEWLGARFLSIDEHWWELWLSAAGERLPEGRPAYSLWNTQLLVAQATLAGLGVGLLSPFIMQDQLQSGELIQLSTSVLQHPSAHWVAFPRKLAEKPAVRLFIDWIAARAQEEANILEAA